MRLEAVQPRAVGHGAGDGHDLGILVGQFDQRIGEDFGIGALLQRFGLAGLRIVRPQAMELLLLLHGRLEPAAFLREHVHQHGAVLLLEKLKRLDERGNIVAVDGPVIFDAQFFKDHAGPQHALGGFFGLARHFEGHGAAQFLDEFAGAVVQVIVARAGDDGVEIGGDGADVLIDGPFVVVQHHQQFLGVVRDVVQRFVGDAAGERRVAGQRHDVFFAARLVARHRHSQGRRKSRAGVSGAVAIVRAFGAQHEAVQPAGRADGAEALAAAGEQLVHVGLVAHIEEEMVLGRFEHVVHGDGQFHHAQIRAQVPAVGGKDRDQLLADLRGQ